jgi:hypothetical protein
MRKTAAFILVSILLVGLPVEAASRHSSPFDRREGKRLAKLIRKEDKEQRKQTRRGLRHRRVENVVLTKELIVRNNFGRRRSALAHHQQLERLALRRHQMEERRLSRHRGMSARVLAMHQREERRRLQQHQQQERLAIRP